MAKIKGIELPKLYKKSFPIEIKPQRYSVICQFSASIIISLPNFSTFPSMNIKVEQHNYKLISNCSSRLSTIQLIKSIARAVDSFN